MYINLGRNNVIPDYIRIYGEKCVETFLFVNNNWESFQVWNNSLEKFQALEILFNIL